jgi:hypothetical protein
MPTGAVPSEIKTITTVKIAYANPKKDRRKPPSRARRAGTREVDTKPLIA